MDSLTQAVLGGAVGYCVAGKNAPRKAILYGATLGTLPDLDVLVQYSNDLASYSHHRGWSHSWLVHTVVAPLIAWLAEKADNTFNYTTWLLMIWLCFITHSGLDALTVYGTQLFWPFMPPPISIGSTFIIDPVYTVPLLLGVLFILFKPTLSFSHKTIKFGVIASSVYLIWGLTAQTLIQQRIVNALNEQNISYTKLKVIASPLNTLLWRVIVINNENYYETYSSVLDPKNHPIHFDKYKRHANLLTIEQSKDLKQLDWFTNGFYAMDQKESLVIAKDLRMGTEPYYFFSFKLAEVNGENMDLIKPSYMPRTRDSRLLEELWNRIWSP